MTYTLIYIFYTICYIIYISVCRKTFTDLTIFSLSLKDKMFPQLGIFHVTAELGSLGISRSRGKTDIN
jgi:hypothetical protein